VSSELWADPIPLVLSSAGRNTGATSEDQLVAPFGRDGDESTVEIAFVNNMPDSAFEATEQQFIGLLERATTEIGDTTVVLHRYGLPGLSRSEEIEKRLADDYRPLEDLYRTRPDGLIVTGTEPRADDLRNEPYWEPLAGLIAWAERGTASAVVSCLSAHAAALLFDGVDRRTLPAKCSGVLSQQVMADHPLTEGLGDLVRIPHSRLNDLPADDLRSRGYANLIESPGRTWTVAVKERGACLFVLVQGHPEYSTTSLLREYRRDLQRFLRGERDVAPAIPTGYLEGEGLRLLECFEAQALAHPRCPELMKDFPFEKVAESLVNTWQVPGTRLYANWLTQIKLRRHSIA
jgi:homoserine O-succinyltransferase